MSRASYPQGSDVIDVLKANSMWPESTVLQDLIEDQADTAVTDSVAHFEKSAGWLPFLSSGEDSTRYYDRINRAGNVLLDGGLLSCSSVAIHGSPFVIGTAVWLKPANAPGQGRPFLKLEFLPWLFQNWSWPIPNAIAVTGEWGYSQSVPDDVWKSITRHAAAAVITGIQATPYVQSTEQEDFKQSFNISGDVRPMDTVKFWQGSMDSCINRYKFVAVG